jgi:endonuclease YncB( thermonuclease family)
VFPLGTAGDQLLLAARSVRVRLALVALVLWSVPAFAQERFAGRVVGITDGDTISVMREGRSVRVRLEGIDCPERGQDFGQRAKQFTSDMAFGKDAAIEVRDIDRYGRLVARVTVDGEEVSLALVRSGLAWHYKKYSRDSKLAEAEMAAKSAKLGLWSHSAPTPPWEFRQSAPLRRNPVQSR